MNNYTYSKTYKTTLMYTKPFDAFLKFLSFSAVCLLAACNSPSSNGDAKKQNETPVTAPAAKAIFPGDTIPVFYMGRQELYNQIRTTAPEGKFKQMNIVLEYLYDPKTAGLGLNAWYFASNGNNRFDVSKVPAFLPKPGRKSEIKLNDSTYLSLNILYAKPWGGGGSKPSEVNKLVTDIEKLDPKYQWIVFTPVIKSNYGKNFLCWKIIAEEAEPNAFVPGPLSFVDLADFNPSPPYGLGEQ
jgi:hypothetical protein